MELIELKSVKTLTNLESNELLLQKSFNSNSNPNLQLRSYNKWSPSEEGATLVWRDLCVYAGNHQSSSKNFKRIINNSAGAIQPGTLMALMGSSGSGKTTLMSTLAYRQHVGTLVQGDILINGRKIGPFMNRISGYVHQEDLFIGVLTVKEHLTFMANFKLDRRIKYRERQTIVQDLLKETGLISLANSRIGGSSDDKKVLSGGEKKRLAFATELLNNPLILFCDEPTTGLDAFSAQQIIQTLYDLAKNGTTILCTIHQPSSQLFAMFNNVLLLANGRIAFTGTPQEAIKFFADNGYNCPQSYNPADFLIGILASDPGHERASERSAQYLCDLFAVSVQAKQRDMLVNLEFHMAESSEYQLFENTNEFNDYYSQYWHLKLYWLWLRMSMIAFRDPTIQLLRILQKIVFALIIGFCFAGTTEVTQLGVQAVQGALFVMISENTFHPMYSVLNVFPRSFPLFLREQRSGLYNVEQYYIANTISMLPGLIGEPILFVIICYWLIGLNPTFNAFWYTTICITLVINIATACGCVFSAAFNSVPLAMAYLVPLDYIVMITSGIFIKISTIPTIFYWTQYLSWMLYAYEAMTIVQWNGIQNITCFEEIEGLPCLRTGQEVLEKYSFNATNLNLDLFIMFMLYLGLHFLAYFFLWRNSRKM